MLILDFKFWCEGGTRGIGECQPSFELIVQVFFFRLLQSVVYMICSLPTGPAQVALWKIYLGSLEAVLPTTPGCWQLCKRRTGRKLKAVNPTFSCLYFATLVCFLAFILFLDIEGHWQCGVADWRYKGFERKECKALLDKLQNTNFNSDPVHISYPRPLALLLSPPSPVSLPLSLPQVE